ncbi:MAG: hypothetical protein EOP58_14470 [Sphingomonadales bacterium]|nr:MAG: hypothetical protein EOP58_14470 [Sphingomonadales bacterium]
MSPAVSEAIVQYLGYETDSYPQSREEVLQSKGFFTRRNVRKVLRFVNALEPDWTRVDLVGAGNWAEQQTAKRFPSLTKQAISALGWAATYGWK